MGQHDGVWIFQETAFYRTGSTKKSREVIENVFHIISDTNHGSWVILKEWPLLGC